MPNAPIFLPDAGIEGNVFTDVTTRYSPDPAGGAGTVSFRAVMNLWSVMVGIDGDVTPTAIAAITNPITNIVIKNSVMCLLFVCAACYACDSLR